MSQASFRSGWNGFQDTHLPMRTWFRAMWCITSQKNGMSALGLQRVLGLGSYRTAWLMLHKLRQAMVRPGREKLRGEVEVDETYWGRRRIRRCNWPKNLKQSVDHRCRRSRRQKDRAHPYGPHRGL